MIKVFELNKNKKIELTKEELENLLNQAYWEGYRNYWTCIDHGANSPYTITNTSDSSSITIKG